VSRYRSYGLLACGGLLMILTGVGLYAQHENQSAAFVAVALLQGAVYLAAAMLIWRGNASQAGSLLAVLAVAAALRIAVLTAPPYLSSDIYRYIWDGRVTAAGLNPYRYIPTDPQLERLRDSEIFPEINRNNYAPTIYPPLAQVIFLIVTRISESVLAMKTAMVVFEAIAIALLLRLLVAASLPAERIVLYAWHPLPIWEFAGSGHIDAAIVMLVALALWNRRRFDGWPTGLALAAGVLVKLYPGVLFPAFYRRWDWRMPAVFMGFIVLAYLPFLGVGWRVFGFLPDYMAEEGFTGAGSGFYLWSLVQLIWPFGQRAVFLCAALSTLLLGGLAVWAAFGRRASENAVTGAAVLAGTLMLLLSPHYPWYFAWLILFATLLPSVALLWLPLASLLLYLLPSGPGLVRDGQRMLIESLIYVPFVMLALLELWYRSRGERLKHDACTSR
jgi:alpha-1,6-mannosyltransferase